MFAGFIGVFAFILFVVVGELRVLVFLVLATRNDSTPKGIDRDARSAEEGECEEFHQFHHCEVEVVCVLL